MCSFFADSVTKKLMNPTPAISTREIISPLLCSIYVINFSAHSRGDICNVFATTSATFVAYSPCTTSSG